MCILLCQNCVLTFFFWSRFLKLVSEVCRSGIRGLDPLQKWFFHAEGGEVVIPDILTAGNMCIGRLEFLYINYGSPKACFFWGPSFIILFYIFFFNRKIRLYLYPKHIFEMHGLFWTYCQCWICYTWDFVVLGVGVDQISKIGRIQSTWGVLLCIQFKISFMDKK